MTNMLKQVRLLDSHVCTSTHAIVGGSKVKIGEGHGVPIVTRDTTKYLFPRKIGYGILSNYPYLLSQVVLIRLFQLKINIFYSPQVLPNLLYLKRS